MNRVTRIAFLLLAMVATVSGALPGGPAPQTRMRLLLSHEVARPGETITAALEMVSAPGWHTYWRNPGDAGIATSIEWELPAGVNALPIQWPVPAKTTLLQLGSYAFEGTEYLLIPIKISPDAKNGTVDLKGLVDWLECEKTCIPQDTNVVATLTIADASKLSGNTAVIEKARERLPNQKPPFAVSAKWETGEKINTRNLVIEWTPEKPASNPDFYPFETENFTVGTGTVVENKGEKVRIKKEVTLGDDIKEWPQAIGGLIINDSSAKPPVAYEARLNLPAGTSAAAGTSDTAGVTFGDSPAQSSIWAVLGIAFLGGLILNIMPCVLPVIALKILSFVNQSGASPKRARQLGLIYALGVLTSFAVLAGLIIAVQRTGQIASWGMQYQSPVFLVVMITLVTLISLNLFGVFEITLGGKTMGAASELASKEGSGGAFFNGVLATVLGTSCTAPFLAFAIGYALGQPAWVILLVFLMMGVGLAFPYVVLTWNPALLKMLPKPGAWMEKFKVGMGFPMLATAVWLYSVAVKAHFGASGAFWLAMFLLLVSFAVWVFGAFIQRGAKRKPIAALASVGALVLAVGFVLEKQLSWRSPNYARNIATSTKSQSEVDWQKWSPELVAKVRAEGRPILVDFTADWCPNCQVNKYSSIEIEVVERKLKEINAVAMIGDFTLKDPIIAEELKRFKRYAVPLVLVYPADASKPPMILPEILTPQIVLDALDNAKGAGSTSRENDKALTATTR